MKKNSFLYKILRYCKFILMNIVNIPRKIKMNKITIINDFYKIIDDILSTNKSVARYGDSELRLMIDVNPGDYQEPSIELSKRLQEILSNHDNLDNVLIGINSTLKHNKEDNYQQKHYFSWFMMKYFDKFYKYFNKNIKYINASFTRIYLRTSNKKDVNNKFEYIKQIWKDRNIVFVEGKDSKLGVGNDLFAGAKSVKRIICPSKNAFDYYNEILNECKKQDKDTLFLVALGATATILSYDLCKDGYQSLDLGHIDLEYEWFKMGVSEAVPVKGKYTNESVGDKLLGEIIDKDYENSIISSIGV